MSRFTRLSIVVLVALAVTVASAGPAGAVAPPSAGWTVESFPSPSVFSSGDTSGCQQDLKSIAIFAFLRCDSYSVVARETGSAGTDSSEVTLSDTVPAGLTVQRVVLTWSGLSRSPIPEYTEETDLNKEFSLCSQSPSGAATVVRCEAPAFLFAFFGPVAPDDELRMRVVTTVEEPAPTRPLFNSVSVSGGGGPEADASSETPVGGPVAGFGFSRFDFYIDGQNGARDNQAADHPYELTTAIDLNTNIRLTPDLTDHVIPDVPQDVRDVVVDLPVGFVGSILAAPQCTFSQLSSAFGGGCPANTIVGHIRTEPESQADGVHGAIYNMVPEHGVPAEFAYVDELNGSHVFYAHVVPTPQGYVLQTINPDIPQVALTRIVVTFYGNPAERDGTNNAPIPFFTNPPDCTDQEPTATIYMDSWQKPAKFNADGTPVNLEEAAWARMESKSPPMTGCNALQFPAEIKAQPTTHEADAPSGMDFEIKIPQSETMGVPATPTLKTAVVTLPEGFTVDPSAGNGLAACSEAQIGWLGPYGPHGEAMPRGGVLNFNAAEPSCPGASKIGSLELESPLVPHALKGEMFLASQNENPYHSTLAAYVVVNDPITGVLIKIAGKFTPDPVTGRLAAEFAENPNLPFSNLELHFFGGPRAELATPESCGTFMVATEMFPYSFEEPGSPPTPSDAFPIDEACPTGGFSPSFAAGSTNLQAGSYTPFVASFQRSDTDQELSGLTVTLPPGLLAKVSGVPQCSEAEIQAIEMGTGGCPEGTQVGAVKAGVGPGPDPFFATGKAYWTGPYNGGPFGLAVVVPAVAGPFNFGTVVVRQSIRIDPKTAQVTDVSDPFPTIIDGIPLRMRRVDIALDRPGFTFNPTNCEKLGFNGTITGSPLGAPRSLDGSIGYATQSGARSSFTTPFQVTNCATLGFKPAFTVSTSGKTSRRDGASLHVKLTYPSGSFGKDANIAKVKVDLPKQLPSRLDTLKRACIDTTFEHDPSACPAASRIGIASATTPILPVRLEGPVYFISHAGLKWPELVIVLQGNGITVDLRSETFISKTGITSSTFRMIPDVPVNTFELTLPQGPYSALAANTNLCDLTRVVTKRRKVTITVRGKKRYVTRKVRTRTAGSLVMPTAFTAQNGMVIHQNTPIEVTGCARQKVKKVARRNRGRGRVKGHKKG